MLLLLPMIPETMLLPCQRNKYEFYSIELNGNWFDIIMVSCLGKFGIFLHDMI